LTTIADAAVLYGSELPRFVSSFYFYQLLIIIFEFNYIKIILQQIHRNSSHSRYPCEEIPTLKALAMRPYRYHEGLAPSVAHSHHPLGKSLSTEENFYAFTFTTNLGRLAIRFETPQAGSGSHA
jgi:hypothetical protein